MQMVEGLEDEDDLLRVAQELPEPSDLLESEDDAPIIRLINAVLTQAVKENASDLHIEPFENRHHQDRLLLLLLVDALQVAPHQKIELLIGATQFDIDTVGTPSMMADAEILVAMGQALETGHEGDVNALHCHGEFDVTRGEIEHGIEPRIRRQPEEPRRVRGIIAVDTTILRPR